MPAIVIVQVVEPELTWVGSGFRRGVAISIADDGRIAAVGKPGRAPALRLDGTALLPGLINAHSHAFQRGLLGAGEDYGADRGSFWSWRRTMYETVAQLDADAVFEISRGAFRDMRAAGFTAVAEFHYLHHESPGDYALDHTVLRAAKEAGLRIVLLQTFYSAGGFDAPLEPEQRRFETADLDAFWDACFALRSTMGHLQSLGVAVHSLRAVPLPTAVALRSAARRRSLPFHMHVEEQPAEVEACLEAHGATPMDLVLERLSPADDFCAVHCTHTDPKALAAFVARGATVCVCPSTEGSLGDGLPPLAAAARIEPALTEGGSLCIGTDANQRLAAAEELRWLEYGQRLSTGERGVVAADGNVAAGLVAAGTAGGARAAGLPAGRIAPGAWADFTLLDLGHRVLRGATPAQLAAAWLFGCGNDAVLGTCVAGRWTHRHGTGPPTSPAGVSKPPAPASHS